MTDEDRKLLTAFEGKFRHLMYLYEELKKENADLRQKLARKEADLKSVESSCKAWEARYANLKAARIISVNDGELRDTKQRLAKLVREVDWCIDMLSQ